MANTGEKIVLTLKEMETVSNTPTGDTKSNDPLNSDYIAPYNDFTACPLSYTLTCVPVVVTGGAGTVEYEFSIPNSTKNNPALESFRIKVMSGATVKGTKTFNKPFSNFNSGTITGVAPGASLTIDIEYLDNLNAVIQSCTGAQVRTITVS